MGLARPLVLSLPLFFFLLRGAPLKPRLHLSHDHESRAKFYENNIAALRVGGVEGTFDLASMFFCDFRPSIRRAFEKIVMTVRSKSNGSGLGGGKDGASTVI